MTIKHYHLHGIIKTLSPLHIAAPGSVHYDLVTGTYPKKDVKTKVMDCTGIQQLHLPSLRAPDSDEGRAYQSKVPLIAANNFSGGLRRSACAVVFDALLAKNQRVEIGTYSAMTCGAVTGSPDGAMVKFEEYREARAHPFVGLFGGGPRMFRRHVRLNNMVPLTRETEFMFQGIARHPAFDDVEQLDVMVPDRVRLVHQFHFVRNDDLLKFVDFSMQEKVIRDFEASMLERQTKIFQAQATAGEDGAEKANTFTPRTMSSYEFVIPGIAFPMVCDLEVTEEQLGLFLLALDRFCEKERIGGAARNGFGQFVMENVVLVDVETGEVKKHLFSSGRLDRDESGAAFPYLQAWYTAAQSKNFTADRLNHLLRPGAPKKGKKNKSAVEKTSADAAVSV